MFKVHKEEDVQPILDQYKIVEANAQKDGKSYIRQVSASQTIGDPRNQGFKIVALTKFDSLDDMKYYDDGCEAHKNMKKFALGKVEMPPLTVFSEI